MTEDKRTEAMRELTKETGALREAIENSPVVQRLRLMVRGLLVLALMQAVLLGGAVYLYDQIKDQQVISCQNANETRKGQRQAWDFIIDVSAGDEQGNPAELAVLQTIRTWLHDVFAERDCSNLGKEYEVPPPPDVEKLLAGLEDDK